MSIEYVEVHTPGAGRWTPNDVTDSGDGISVLSRRPEKPCIPEGGVGYLRKKS